MDHPSEVKNRTLLQYDTPLVPIYSFQSPTHVKTTLFDSIFNISNVRFRTGF